MRPVDTLSFSQQSLANGTPLYTVAHHSQPFVSLQTVIKSGARNDGHLHGLANATTSLLAAGAGKRDAVQFAQDLELFGADLDNDAGRETLTIRLGVLKRYLPDTLELLADMLLRPQFDPEEVAREQEQKIASLKQNRSEPDWLASVQLRHEVYGNTPDGFSVEGTEQSLRQIDSKACRDFHATHVTGNNAFIVGAGDIEAEELELLLNKHFGSWNGTAPPQPPPPTTDAPRQSPQRIVIVNRPGSAHTAVRIGRPGIPRRDPDFIALRILNTLFGDYFNSRLNMRLREDLGYTYGAWSFLSASMHPGLFMVGTSVRADRAGETLEAIFREMTKIASEPVEREELETVKSYMLGHQALRMETPEQMAAMVRALALYNLPRDYFSRTIAETQHLTREDILRVGNRYMQPESMTVVLAGDARKIEPEVAHVGEVITLDNKGKPI